MARGRRSSTPDPRRYPRSVRVNELVHEIVADEIERIDDERLELVTVIHVHVDPDLRHGVVDFSSLREDEDAALEALLEHRHRLQAAIWRPARLKRAPDLRLSVEHVTRHRD